MKIFDVFKKNKKEKAIDYSYNLLTQDTNFNIIEAYKTIRANINFAFPKPGCKKIMMCSSLSGEGKTTTSINLAVTIAQAGYQVLLIDCDLRKSKVHKYLNIENTLGITDYLSNMVQLENIVRETEIENLNIITAGSVPPNPAELLMSNKFEKIFNIAGQISDYIIIDTPPLCLVSDALPLSKLCDGVILVVKHLETKHPQIKESLEKLEFAGANVAGFIINGIKITRTKKSYGKYYKYSYKDEYKDKPEEKTVSAENNESVENTESAENNEENSETADKIIKN